ncbi:7,8-didemethyl-8-hydroxy-5-deazariboflavin synthase subunit CofG [Leptolyngbya sp. 'hensonii']|uniref:7,8-didemethyl-8-hydroxy-5-deazariboflavin synthase subunit CofG n=1 Tax=Leptolyngbya sp. 'hensonii' TaxID=1922337 RepID=UPI00094FADEF|nr:7,8-didemethyl-8-hydroxy-5-deazariboflavin synthase subunit CofG [Leptolyngbya sp. 'hensonii']OLP15458.1 7,8-didemethyl-8-hydroxy-5-deazariboflavin synthase subunit CofG [Leptolyngbya sp. 'hensonii']
MNFSLLSKVTYSPAYTLVPTFECFNHCTYCNFRAAPGQSPWLTLAEAEARLKPLQSQGVIEILILSGEVHPASPRRQDWFQHIYRLCQLALDLGFLPHTNAGPLSFSELESLRTVNVSMGLMLEQITPMLLETVHRHAPSKVPELRVQQLEWAGQLKIPFTTGLLLGIGESEQDRCETLATIAQLHQRWGHIQEVILQPHSTGQKQSEAGTTFPFDQFLRTIALAREILPGDITLQVPPNLIPEPSGILACLQVGARDLGGIGPIDEVNPDYPHPLGQDLVHQLNQAGWQLVPRLPIYPQFDHWLDHYIYQSVKEWREKLT